MKEKFKSVIDKYLLVEQDDTDSGSDEDQLLSDVVSFLLDIDENQLSDDMLQRYADLLDELDMSDGDEDVEESDLSEVRILKKTAAAKKRLSRMYYKKNRAKLAAKRKRVASKKARLAKAGRGLSGAKLGMTKRVGTH
jgi:hypothetical protein